MKTVLIIGLCFVALVNAQKSATTKNPSNDAKNCDMTKLPKNESIESCCPSYPNFKSSSLYGKCLKNCSIAKDQKDKPCCISNCIMTSINGFNADGKFNAKNIVNSLVSVSKSGKKYEKNAQKLVEQCINVTEKISSNKTSNSTCKSTIFEFCVARKAFLDCPDMRNSTGCKNLNDFATKCHRFPLTGYEGSVKNEIPKKASKNPTKSTSKSPKAKPNDSKLKTTKSPTTTDHPSKSENGVHGAKGPGFKL